MAAFELDGSVPAINHRFVAALLAELRSLHGDPGQLHEASSAAWGERARRLAMAAFLDGRSIDDAGEGEDAHERLGLDDLMAHARAQGWNGPKASWLKTLPGFPFEAFQSWERAIPMGTQDLKDMTILNHGYVQMQFRPETVARLACVIRRCEPFAKMLGAAFYDQDIQALELGLDGRLAALEAQTLLEACKPLDADAQAHREPTRL